MEELYRAFPARTMLLMVSFILVLGVSAQALGRRFQIPAILFMMGFGFLVGPDGLGWVQPSKLGYGLRTIVSVAVAIIVFEGSMLLDLRQVWQSRRSILGLLTVGATVTLGLSSILVHYVLGLSWSLSLLCGSILSLTGPTVVFPILKRLPLKENLKTIIEAESVLVDAVGILLTTTLFSSVIITQESALGFGSHFLFNLLVGLGIGAACGWLLRTALERLDMPGDLSRIMVLSIILFGYAVAEMVAHHAGIVMVATAGLALSSARSAHWRDIQQLKGDLTLICLGFVFILLTATIPVAAILALGWRGLIVGLLLMGVIRPVAVALSTLGVGLSLSERAYIAWMGPRGIVAASMATLMSFKLAAAGIPGAVQLGPLVFLVVILTVLIQGSTADWVARRLGLLRIERSPLGQSRETAPIL